MLLKSLHLKNFRCFTDETIELNEYTAFVGANNAGKSAIVAALDIFFRSNPKSIPLTFDDFFRREKRPLEIRLTFSELSKDAENEFEHYARAGELSFYIKASIDTGQIVSSLHGIRLANPALAKFFEVGSAAEKKDFYNSQKATLELPNWQNISQATAAIREYENKHTHLNVPIPSDDKAFGVEGPIPKLRKFIDFVYIPAVKDAREEAIESRNTAFSRLVDRAVRAKLKIEERLDKIRATANEEINAIAEEHTAVLSELERKIEGEYKKFNVGESKLHLGWSSFDAKNLEIRLPPVQLEISDDLIKNSIGKFGHGTQRNYLMALLMVSASYDFSDLQTIIIACEEPELYQHPPQARILANAFAELVSSQTQMLITTHSPFFVSAKSFENIRVVRRTRGERSKAYRWSLDENCNLIAQVKGEDPIGTKAAIASLHQFLQPQMNELFFSPAIVLVEGEEDKALLSKYFELSKKYRFLLASGVSIIPVSGKGNLINAIAIARGFEIPHFVICDGDMNCEPKDLENNIKLNRNILSLLSHKGAGSDGKIEDIVCGSNFLVWKHSIQEHFDNADAWSATKTNLSQEFGWTLDRLRKSSLLLEAALERYHSTEKSSHLEQASSAILKCFSSPAELSAST